MRTNWWRNPALRSGLLVGGTLLVAVVGQVAMPPAPRPAPTVVVPISSLALACPALPAGAAGLAVSVRAGLLGNGSGATADVQSSAPQHAAVPPNGVVTLPVRRPGAALVAAQGQAAPQLVADASLIGTTATTAGYAEYACQAPSASQWLVGGSSVVGRTSVLNIANIDDTPATVDVDVWSEQGKSAARSLQGIAIPPRSVKAIALALVDPGRAVYAVHVMAASGQVTSAIVDRGQHALASLGIDVIEPFAQPLASGLVGIVPGGSRGATLALLSPGVPTAVHVSLVTSDGTYPLAGAENLTLDADRVLRVPIPDAAVTGDVAVLVQADTPVIAGVAESLALRGGSDIASEPFMAPIYRNASFTVDAGVSRATLLLHSDIAVDATVIDAVGARRTTTTVHVRPGVVTRLRVVNGRGRTHLISVLPGTDGVVRGSVLFEAASAGMDATSVAPLLGVRGYVAVPPVAPDVSR